MRISRIISILAAVFVLSFATTLTSSASAAPSRSSEVAATVAAGAPSKSWKTWHCGKAEAFDNYGKYQCKRYVKFNDFCGSGRPMRLNQVTKMRGLMYNAGHPPTWGNVRSMHSWKAVPKAKKRNMRVGQVSSYLYVVTPVKPDAKPTISCDAP